MLVRKEELSTTPTSADRRGTEYHRKVRALDRQNFVLGFAEHDYSDVRDQA